MLELKSYNVDEIIGDEENILEEFLTNYSETSAYICDAITELADIYIPTYNSDVWEHVSDIQEHIEEAIASGIAPISSGEVDLIRIFQEGYYQYYTQILYDNLDELAYNCIANAINEFTNTLTEEQVDSIDFGGIEERLEQETESYDNNEMFHDLAEFARTIINEIKEELGLAEEEVQ